MSDNDLLWEEALGLAERDYDVETFRDTLTDGTVLIVAKSPELKGCMAHGMTRDEAIANLKGARAEYIYTLLQDDLPVPYPASMATSTNPKFDEKPSDTVGVARLTVVGFGKSASQVSDQDATQEDIAFSYRGDIVQET